MEGHFWLEVGGAVHLSSEGGDRAHSGSGRRRATKSCCRRRGRPGSARGRACRCAGRSRGTHARASQRDRRAGPGSATYAPARRCDGRAYGSAGADHGTHGPRASSGGARLGGPGAELRAAAERRTTARTDAGRAAARTGTFPAAPAARPKAPASHEADEGGAEDVRLGRRRRRHLRALPRQVLEKVRDAQGRSPQREHEAGQRADGPDQGRRPLQGDQPRRSVRARALQHGCRLSDQRHHARHAHEPGVARGLRHVHRARTARAREAAERISQLSGTRRQGIRRLRGEERKIRPRGLVEAVQRSKPKRSSSRLRRTSSMRNRIRRTTRRRSRPSIAP